MKKTVVASLLLIVVSALTQSSLAQTFSILYNFVNAAGSTDGFGPNGGLVMDASGNLYGTTTSGGASSSGGTLFKISPNGTETILHDFGIAGDGSVPNGSLVLSGSMLYGITFSGGTFNHGTVYSYNITTGVETVLYSLGTNPLDGGSPVPEPYEGPYRDAQGNLYGTTYVGGSAGLGSIFQVSASGAETVLHSFTGPDGEYPGGLGCGSMVADAQGNLYDTTYAGGAYGSGMYNGGTVYKLNPSTRAVTVLHSFGKGSDLWGPQSGLTIDANGNLYGAASGGGAFGAGGIFEISPAGVETILYSFESPISGATPSLVLDAEGNLYGNTYGEVGYYLSGVAFQLAPSGLLTVLHLFPNSQPTTDAIAPKGALLRDPAGNLYGATQSGGTTNGGTVFKITPANSAKTTAVPVFSPPPGTYTSPQSVTVTDGTAGAAIDYETNEIASTTGNPYTGVNPTPYTGAISVSSNTMLSAIAAAPNYANSAPVMAVYLIVPGPAASLSPTSLAFGSQQVGSSSAAKTVTLTNTGTAALTLSAQVTGTNAAEFSQTNTCGSSLASNASCTYSVKFSPTSAGAATAALTLTDNATGSPQSVPLTGTGLTSQTITFGSAPTVTVGKTGNVSATASSGLAVTFSSTTTSFCTISGATVTGIAAGTCTIAANQAGNSTYAPAPQVTQSFTVGKGSQTITFGTAPSLSVGSNATVSATASSGLAVTFTSTTTNICTISGYTLTGVAAGTCTIAANQAGNANYNAAPQVTQSITVTASSKKSQTITFGAAPSVTVGKTGTATATASSGLVVTFTSTTTSTCSISGSTVTGLAVGTCTIAANQAGNATYSAAPQVTQIFTIGIGTQTISLSVPRSITRPATGRVTATATSGLAVTLTTTTPKVCSISGTTVKGLAAGTCTIAANQSGNANYNPAPQVTGNIVVH